jgi:hypothetical protein
MANVCEFSITATGPEAALKASHDYLEPRLRPCPGGAYAESTIETKDLWPGHVQGHGHDWIGVDKITLQPDKLIITGACKWAPPTIIGRLSEQYPDLVFVVRACTEHESCEEWQIQDGKARCIEMFTDNVREGTRTYTIKDGIDLVKGQPSKVVDMTEDASTPINNKEGSE